MLKFVEINASLHVRDNKDIASNGVFRRKQRPITILSSKIALFNQYKVLPKTALLLEIYPTGYFNVFKVSFDSAFYYRWKLLFENKFNNNFMIRYSIGYEHSEDFNPNKKYTFSLTPIVTINEKWRAYVELHGFRQKTKPFVPMLYNASGVQYCINDKLRVDINGGYNINKNRLNLSQTHLYYGLGVVYKFD